MDGKRRLRGGSREPPYSRFTVGQQLRHARLSTFSQKGAVHGPESGPFPTRFTVGQ